MPRFEKSQETGVVAQREVDLGHLSYEIDGQPKTVRFWLMGFREDLGVRDAEADDVRWCTLDEARSMVTYAHDVQFLDAIDPATRPGRVWLVRHAKAGSRSTYDGDDAERPLTTNGWAQAQTIADALADRPIARLISSPYVRCTQTLEGLAARLGRSVEADAGLAEGNDAAAVWQWCEQPEPVVLCSHGDVLGDAMDTLAAAGIVEANDAGMPAKGSVWRLKTIGGTVVDATAVDVAG